MAQGSLCAFEHVYQRAPRPPLAVGVPDVVGQAQEFVVLIAELFSAWLRKRIAHAIA